MEKVERVENEREMPCKEQEHTHAMVIYNDIHVYNPLHKYHSLTESQQYAMSAAHLYNKEWRFDNVSSKKQNQRNALN